MKIEWKNYYEKLMQTLQHEEWMQCPVHFHSTSGITSASSAATPGCRIANLVSQKKTFKNSSLNAMYSVNMHKMTSNICSQKPEYLATLTCLILSTWQRHCRKPALGEPALGEGRPSFMFSHSEWIQNLMKEISCFFRDWIWLNIIWIWNNIEWYILEEDSLSRLVGLSNRTQMLT